MKPQPKYGWGKLQKRQYDDALPISEYFPDYTQKITEINNVVLMPTEYTWDGTPQTTRKLLRSYPGKHQGNLLFTEHYHYEGNKQIVDLIEVNDDALFM